MHAKQYDAVIIGSGPNGLAAAIALQRKGLSVLVVEGKDTIGGGMRTQELAAPGYWADVCSAVHPMGAGSPFFQELPLHQFGLEYIHPEVLAAHPFDDGSASVLKSSLSETAALLGQDKDAYLNLFGPLVDLWPNLAGDVLGPLRFPKHPLDMAAFGLKALKSGIGLSKRFKTKKAKGLIAGMAAHSLLSLDEPTTAAVALVLMTNGHLKGWPIVKGGSQKMADALAGYFKSIGGEIETGRMVRSLNDLPKAKAIVFDLSPKQILDIAGNAFSKLYKWQLKRFRYSPGAFKIDWALSGPVPFTAPECRQAGTVHLGGTQAEVAHSERESNQGKHSNNPFVLLAQQSLFDNTRAPEGKHTLWGYCHVPNGSAKDMTEAIERQVERFAPGFRDLIIAKKTLNAPQLEAYNPNYIGGDINGGRLDLRQLYTRPAITLSPYSTSAKGIYICSASTPPGGGGTWYVRLSCSAACSKRFKGKVKYYPRQLGQPNNRVKEFFFC